MKRQLLLLVLLLSLLVVSCSDDDKCTCPEVSITGSGTMTSVTRPLTSFSGLVLNAAGNVNITLGSTQNVTITVDDNILQYITTEVDHGTLEIGVEEHIRLSNYDLTVDITMTDLEAAVLSGSGSIAGQHQFELDVLNLVLSGSGTISMNVDAEALSCVLSGSGNINMEGAVNQYAAAVSGSGAIRAFDLDSDHCAAVLSGSGMIEVTVASTLDAIISGSGTVYYKGHPSITQTISGSGSLVDAN